MPVRIEKVLPLPGGYVLLVQTLIDAGDLWMELVQRILAYFLRFGDIRQQSNHPQIRLNKIRCLRMIKSSNAHQNRQIRYKSYQKMLRKFMRISSIRIKVSRRQNSLYKSATTSRAWPLPGAFLIPPALLVGADLFSDGNHRNRILYRCILEPDLLIIVQKHGREIQIPCFCLQLYI